MAGKSFIRSRNSASRFSARPTVEALEERCVPDAAPLALPPGQTVFQFANTVLQTLEGQRQQVNNTITAIETQQINQLNQNLTQANQLLQALVGKVTADREQFNTDVTNGASLQTQIADLAKIQTDGEAAVAGANLIAQYRQIAIQQTAQQLQVDAQIRFTLLEIITQQEIGFVNQILPAIQAAQLAVAAGPQVGAPLTAGQTASYSGVLTTTTNVPGFMSTTTANISMTLTVSPDGRIFGGPESAIATTQDNITNTPTTMNSTSGAITGGFFNPLFGTAVTGTFTLTFPSGTQTGTFTGFLGSTLFAGQTTDPASGVNTPFVLQRVS